MKTYIIYIGVAWVTLPAAIVLITCCLHGMLQAKWKLTTLSIQD